jgi:hypothetical protein
MFTFQVKKIDCHQSFNVFFFFFGGGTGVWLGALLLSRGALPLEPYLQSTTSTVESFLPILHQLHCAPSTPNPTGYHDLEFLFNNSLLYNFITCVPLNKTLFDFGIIAFFLHDLIPLIFRFTHCLISCSTLVWSTYCYMVSILIR